MYKVDNAVIMAAGTSSRFAPLSYEKPKALIQVRGEVLIERQIRQLREAGVQDIYIVVGYKAEQFAYLEKKFGVNLVYNKEFLTRNNNGSIYVVKDIINNTYICSADNYFTQNPFECEVEESYYSTVYADGETQEWCIQSDELGYINRVTIGGKDEWYMLGHVFWCEEFSKKFIEILEKEYDLPETKSLLWESIFMKHLSELKMLIRKYSDDIIFEFDTLDELRRFDPSYINDTKSEIIKDISRQLGGTENEIINVISVKGDKADAIGFEFDYRNVRYVCMYKDKSIRRIVDYDNK